MTVRELVNQLSACDQNAEVVFDDGEDEDGCDITGIEDEGDVVMLLSEDEDGDEAADEGNVIDVDFKAIP